MCVVINEDMRVVRALARFWGRDPGEVGVGETLSE